MRSIGRASNALRFAAACALATVPAKASETLPDSPAAILQELRSFGTVATVLHIAAHPDDENTALLTYFARSRGYRTAYLSLTRGDGGQNELGPEFDEKLGVARTQELLAARKLDGGRQFFTRAIDFGYSKTPEETLRMWNHEQVLGDVVRIIRQYRPDVIITRFPIPPGSGGHGHHTASGILGVEAFKLAADPKAYPDQIAQGLSPWQAKRVAWNAGGGRGGGPTGPTVTLDIGGNDPVTGESFAAIASRSRSMHKTQGFGGFGGGGSGGPNKQTFIVLGGEPAEKDLMDGIDTTWARFPDGQEIGTLTEKAIADFKTNAPAASVPALLAIRAKLAALPSDPVVDDKRAQLDRILQACLGLVVETTASQPEVTPGERFKIHQTIVIKAAVPVRLTETRAHNLENAASGRDLKPGEPQTADAFCNAPKDIAMTQPYWLRREGSGGLFRVDDPALIGTPENPAAFPVKYVFEVAGQKLVVSDEPVFIEQNAGKERRRRVDVIPPVSLRFASAVSLFQPGSTRPVTVEAIAARPDQSGAVRLETPSGWSVTPSERPLRMSKASEKAQFTFNVTAPAKEVSERVTASVTIDGRRFSNERIEINYSHLPFILLQPTARARLVCAEVVARGKKAGYLPGAGDSTASALTQLGYDVTTLTGADLTPDKLRGLDVILIGVRAFNERKDLAPNLTSLWAFVENGGTVVAQYNRPNGLRAEPLGPFPLSIQGPAPDLRVTDEQAPVAFLAPENPALTTPNHIGPADFNGWIQERGTYFPSSWDPHYEPILAMNDPGEKPLRGSLLVARYGKGYYVYTGIVFFRQLPAGVPGAYRLFANLLSLGK
jgi:LmbE family N-acetylglucosaminyl deacetylase